MKVKVIRTYHSGGAYTVDLTQGHQGFRLDFHGSKLECCWYARMFRIALKNHDIEVAKKKA